jgi:hypothetical protein
MNKLTDDQIFALAAKSHGCGLSADDLKSCEGEGSAAEFFASELLTFARSIESAHTAPAGDPVATLHVSDFRGYENYEFQHLVDLPPGNYKLFTACASPPITLPPPHELIALWEASNSPSVFARLVLARCGNDVHEPAPPVNGERDMLIRSANLLLSTPPDDTSTPNSTNRFGVRMSDELAKEFEEIQQTTGLNGAEVFRRAIALYKIAKKASKDGEQVILRAKDRERELVSI